MEKQQLNSVRKGVCLFIVFVFAFITVLQPVMTFAEETGEAANQEKVTVEEQDGETEEQQPETSSEPKENAPNDESSREISGGEAAVTQEEEETAGQEYEQQADSWRYEDGYIIDQGSANDLSRSRAIYKPWSKSGGNYISSDGSVITGAKKKGIDVSSWQGKIDWAKVKASDVDFVIIRCGYGSNKTSNDDSYWSYNVSECERLGIPYGVYLYSYAATLAEAKSEANHVLRLLKGHYPTYPVYYDMEDKSTEKANLVKIADTFCSTMEANGYKAGIYANLDWWNSKLNSSTLDKYEKWVAQWNSQCTYKGSYGLWQCTSNGTVAGISGRVDLNFAFTDYSGAWVTDENGQTVFRKADGSIAKSQWITYYGNKYYVNSKGVRVKGFQTISGAKYYFNSGGVVQKSKWITVSGKKYYLQSNGKVTTGYKKIGNYYYGFNSGGVMLTGTATLSGKKYKFDSKGRSYLYTVKTKTALNYRTGYSTKYKKKGTLKKNKTVAIIREKSGWGMMTNGYWIKLSYTKKVTKYPLAVKAKTSSYKVKVNTSSLNYRTGPSTKYKIKGTYKKGKIVTIKSTKNGWGKMSNGYWIKLSYTKKV